MQNSSHLPNGVVFTDRIRGRFLAGNPPPARYKRCNRRVQHVRHVGVSSSHQRVRLSAAIVDRKLLLQAAASTSSARGRTNHLQWLGSTLFSISIFHPFSI